MVIDKKRLLEIFEDTEKQCLENELLKRAIRKTIKKTEVFVADKSITIPKTREMYIPRITISNKRSFEAAIELQKLYCTEKIAVLNFASESVPGGGVKHGSLAQEESLCRCSTLYNCLNTNRLKKDYYNINNKSLDIRGSDTVIYTPGIIVFKSDEIYPVNFTENEHLSFDVITCAAPYRKHEIVFIPKREWKRIYRNRIKRIIKVAIHENVDVLVLGAWGCGAYGGDSIMIAEASKTVLEKYGHYFKAIEFAIYDKDMYTFSDNYNDFKTVFEGEK